jgi:hypothetical protein
MWSSFSLQETNGDILRTNLSSIRFTAAIAVYCCQAAPLAAQQQQQQQHGTHF